MECKVSKELVLHRKRTNKTCRRIYRQKIKTKYTL